MKTLLAITDLTRMYHGNVCIAGYDADRNCIRPVHPAGIPEDSLFSGYTPVTGHTPIIYPFSLIELDLLGPQPQPPHTEDHLLQPGSFRPVRPITDREALLEWSLFPTVEDLFEQPVHKDFGFYVLDCQGPRSLGTIFPSRVSALIYGPGIENGAWDYRLAFYDSAGTYYRLKITDLTFQYYCNWLRSEQCSPAQVAELISEFLKTSKIYLRVGLARGWSRFPERCYLQITGIYTFPDYLGGKTFADVASYSKNTRKGLP